MRCAPGAHAGTIVNADLFYERPGASPEERRVHEALAVEMEAAALFALGAGADVPVACVLAVSDTFDQSGARRRIDDDSLTAAAERMGAAAAAAICA